MLLHLLHRIIFKMWQGWADHKKDCELPCEGEDMIPEGTSSWITFKHAIHEMWSISESNKQCRRLFRSHAELMFEKRRHLKSFPYIIHPYSSLRIKWELLMIGLLLFTFIKIPFDTAFRILQDISTINVIITIIIDVIFVCDICLTFFCGFVQTTTEEIVLDPWRIARKYLSTYFIFDVIATLPLGYIYYFIIRGSATFTPEEQMFYKIFKALSLCRLLRVGTMLKYINEMEEIFDPPPDLMHVLKLGTAILLIIHWSAVCTFMVPAMIHGVGNIHPESWVSLQKLNLETNIWILYIHSLFRAVSNLLLVGYGEISPHTIEDKIVTMLLSIIGSILFAFIVARMAKHHYMKHAARTKFYAIRDELQEYMKYKRLPNDVRRRVFKHYDYKYLKAHFDEEAINESLSSILQAEIKLYNCKRLVKSVPFFQNIQQDVLSQLVSHLKYELFLPNDVILRSGEEGSSMYFLAHGTVAVLSPTGHEICHLSDGAHFGEIALVMKEKRAASIVAIEPCDTYRLDHDDFMTAIEHHPELFKHIETIAYERLEKTLAFEEAHKLAILERNRMTK